MRSGVPDTVPGEASLCLFRVAQEALSNAVRHGRASAVTVLLSPRGSGLAARGQRQRQRLRPERSRDRAQPGPGQHARASAPAARSSSTSKARRDAAPTVVAWVPA